MIAISDQWSELVRIRLLYKHIVNAASPPLSIYLVNSEKRHDFGLMDFSGDEKAREEHGYRDAKHIYYMYTLICI